MITQRPLQAAESVIHGVNILLSFNWLSLLMSIIRHADVGFGILMAVHSVAINCLSYPLIACSGEARRGYILPEKDCNITLMVLCLR